jgi:hypothetical protein
MSDTTTNPETDTNQEVEVTNTINWTPELQEQYDVLRTMYYLAHPQKTNRGFKHTEATKEVLRQKMTGKVHTPLTKATLRWKMLKGWYGDNDSRTIAAKLAVDELS